MEYVETLLTRLACVQNGERAPRFVGTEAER
jgi:hypothetical protein